MASAFNRWWRFLFGQNLAVAGITLVAVAFLINRWAVWAALNDEGYLAWWGVPFCVLILWLTHAGFGLSLGELLRPRQGKVDTHTAIASLLGMLTGLGFAVMTFAMLVFAAPWSSTNSAATATNPPDDGVYLPEKITLSDLQRCARAGDRKCIETSLATNRDVVSSRSFEGGLVPLREELKQNHSGASDLVAAAAKNDHWEIVKRLIDYGDQHGIESLQTSTAYAYAEQLQEIQTMVGMFPNEPIPANTLSAAVGNDRLPEAKFVLQQGVLPRELDFEAAFRQQNAEMFYLLAEHNVDVRIDRLFRNAIDRAKRSDRRQHTFLKELFAEHRRRSR